MLAADAQTYTCYLHYILSRPAPSVTMPSETYIQKAKRPRDQLASSQTLLRSTSHNAFWLNSKALWIFLPMVKDQT